MTHTQTHISNEFDNPVDTHCFHFEVRSCEGRSQTCSIGSVDMKVFAQLSDSEKNAGLGFEFRQSNQSWLVTIEHKRSHDTLSFVQLQSTSVLSFADPFQ